jgi:hypothetical protein
MADLASPGGSRRGGGPRLSAEEWIVLLDIHLRHRSVPGGSTAAIEEVVGLLASLASRRGKARHGAQLRSRHGLLRRMTVLRALERGRYEGQPIEAVETWKRFAKDPAGCGDAAREIRQRAGALLAGAAPRDQGPARRSHGPAPSFGQFTSDREDGGCHVYLMELVGPYRALMNAIDDHEGIFKLGRTNALDRRTSELNQAFPPGLGLAWRPVASIDCDDGAIAHALEQRLLDRLEADGRSLGGEFVRLGRKEAIGLFVAS